MKKYLAIFKCFLTTMIEYRSIPVLWSLVELISLASVIFLWSSVYKNQFSVGGYSLGQMIFYYSLVPIIGSFTEVYVASSLPRQIKDGKISSDLLKPFNFSIAQFARSVGYKVAQQIFKMPIFIIFVLIIFFNYKINLNIGSLFLTLLFCLFAYLLNFLMDLSLSFSAFWIDEVWALKHLKIIIVMIFGGMTFPLDILPSGLIKIFDFLPFRYLYYFPITIARAGIDLKKIVIGFMQMMIWILFFYLLSQLLWKKGIKKYGAYGN